MITSKAKGNLLVLIGVKGFNFFYFLKKHSNLQRHRISMFDLNVFTLFG